MFNFSQIMDDYSQRISLYLLEVYIVILIYSSISSFLPSYQTEASNFILLVICNIIIIVFTLCILCKLNYRLFLENVTKKTNRFFLIFFIILELSTHIIRLVSITLRISANSTSGHILILIVICLFNLTVLSYYHNYWICLLTIFLSTSISFFTLELLVSVIQIYVIMLLLIFYLVEFE